MDINSLLSPSETPRSVSSTPTSPQQSPFKFVQRTLSGPGPIQKHGPGASPLSQSVMNQSSIPAHVLSPANQQMSSPLISPVPATGGSQLARTTSAHSIDTLADLASMQNHGTKSASTQMRNRGGFDITKSPSLRSPAIAALHTSNPRASFDINMMEAPKSVARTDFSGSSLSVETQERLCQLMEYVNETPSAYDSHVGIIKILHQGFIDHIYPPNDSNTRRDPHTYDLLSDLRDARESMEKLFAIGEQLWIDWLQDDSILAETAEERFSVVEQCQRALEEEYGSVSLWTVYGDWVRHCYNWAHDKRRDSDTTIDQERMIGRELFTWDLVLQTWQNAIEQTHLHLSQSHLVWDKFLATMIPNLQQKVDREKVNACMDLFEQRLQTSHTTWDETFGAFSNFVSTNFDDDQYEQIMSETSRSAQDAKRRFTFREAFESAIEQAQNDQDRNAEYDAFMRYLDWEQTPDKRRKLDADLTIALFQRAELRFPSDASIWEEHVSYLLGHSKPVLLPVLERATKHCPWSGSLWSQYLLSSDRAGQAFDETEGIKHKATSTGLLEAAGIEEVIKVHGAWCSYLRRRSFRPDSNEEDMDVAEMGIRSSIENVASLAAKLGLGDVSDPAFRLHRIYIVFLSESGRWDNARQEFDNSVRGHGSSWEFWMLFYQWEMGRWRHFASNGQNSSEEHLSNVAPPHFATAVLKKALDQPSLDYPEPIMQALLTHCEDFEDAEELQSAMLKVQKLRKAVAARRQTEAAMTAEAEAASGSNVVVEDSVSQTTKRKRDEETAVGSNKKARNEELTQQSVEQADPSDQPKRDRENATILVKNLPDDISEIRIRQFFSSCGAVRSLKLLRENDFSAIIEFDDDNAANYALSKNEQELDGALLTVTLYTDSTLYLTNYKPSADEVYLRSLLGKYGEILSIRFPSLQGNKKRRFCYIQFKSPTDAKAASDELDGRKVDDFTLTCKISDPSRRPTRKEEVNDGHTVFVGQLNFKATEEEVEKIFSRFGVIEKIRMPLHPVMKDRNTGIAFVTFISLSDADTAATEMNGQSFQGRDLVVKIAQDTSTSSHRQASSVRSITPIHNGGSSTSDGHPKPATRRERQVFLTNVPDTVNDARLREAAGNPPGLIRIVLKTNHQGAILEFSDVNEAGQASLKLQDHEITSGRLLQVVSENEMLANTKEKKTDGFLSAKDKPKPKAPPIGITPPVRRPQQPGTKKGGNLGQKNMTLHQENSKVDAQANGDGFKKTNDDFRAMLKKNGGS